MSLFNSLSDAGEVPACQRGKGYPLDGRVSLWEAFGKPLELGTLILK